MIPNTASMACLFLLATTAAAMADASGVGGPPGTTDGRLRSESTFFRETEDRAWTLTFRGEVSALAGLHLLLHDSDGRIVFQHTLPFGNHRDQPVVLTVPADGKVDDYRLIMMGDQTSELAIDRPLSDLRYEVQGCMQFETIGKEVCYYFQAPAGLNVMAVRSSTPLWVYRGDQLVGDVIKDGKHVEGEYHTLRTFEFPMEPGVGYWILSSSRYFHARKRPGLFLCVDPNRWFEPQQKLMEVKWWRHVRQ